MRSSSRPHFSGHRGRLRTRFLNAEDSLHEYEYLELLLTFSIARKDTKPIAKELLQRFGTLSAVLDATPEDLVQIRGIGQHTAVLLKLTRKLIELYMRQQSLGKGKISSPADAIEYLRASMGGLKDEQFRALFLNSSNQIVHEAVVCEGTVDQTVVYPRKILELALLKKATGIIVVHNHPSGSLKPSRADRHLTQQLVAVSEALGIRVLDHLIITRDGYFSFKENNLL